MLHANRRPPDPVCHQRAPRAPPAPVLRTGRHRACRPLTWNRSRGRRHQQVRLPKRRAQSRDLNAHRPAAAVRGVHAPQNSREPLDRYWPVVALHQHAASSTRALVPVKRTGPDSECTSSGPRIPNSSDTHARYRAHQQSRHGGVEFGCRSRSKESRSGTPGARSGPRSYSSGTTQGPRTTSKASQPSCSNRARASKAERGFEHTPQSARQAPVNGIHHRHMPAELSLSIGGPTRFDRIRTALHLP